MGYFKIKSASGQVWTISSYDGVFGLPCLGGESHARYHAEMLVTVNNGVICDTYNHPLKIEDAGHGIRGWGFLDASEAYSVGEVIGGNALIPKDIIDGLIKMVGGA